MVNAELHLEPRSEAESHAAGQDSDEYTYYDPLPQSPTAFDTECSVTVHFPEMNGDVQQNLNTKDAICAPPYYAASLSSSISPSLFLSQQGQSTSFSVHRCHHRGIEYGDELPFGFTDVLEQMLHIPSNVSSKAFTQLSTNMRRYIMPAMTSLDVVQQPVRRSKADFNHLLVEFLRTRLTYSSLLSAEVTYFHIVVIETKK